MWKEVFPCLYRHNWPIATLMLKMDTAASLECSFFVKMIKQMLDCIFFILQRHKVRWNALQRTSSLKNLTEERVLKRTQKVSSFYFVSLSLKISLSATLRASKIQDEQVPGLLSARSREVGWSLPSCSCTGGTSSSRWRARLRWRCLRPGNRGRRWHESLAYMRWNTKSAIWVS